MNIVISHPMGAARYVRQNHYAWPGGYPLALIMNDGGVLCPACVEDNFHQVSRSHRDQTNDGWRPAGLVIIEEFTEELCAHCGKEFWPID